MKTIYTVGIYTIRRGINSLARTQCFKNFNPVPGSASSAIFLRHLNIDKHRVIILKIKIQCVSPRQLVANADIKHAVFYINCHGRRNACRPKFVIRRPHHHLIINRKFKTIIRPRSTQQITIRIQKTALVIYNTGCADICPDSRCRENKTCHRHHYQHTLKHSYHGFISFFFPHHHTPQI